MNLEALKAVLEENKLLRVAIGELNNKLDLLNSTMTKVETNTKPKEASL